MAGEFGLVALGQTEQVVQHENLTVAVGSGADADGGNAQLIGDSRREFAGHRLQHHGECSGAFHGAGIAFQLARGVGGFALYVKATQRVNRLRG